MHNPTRFPTPQEHVSVEWNQERATHQCIEIEQHVSLPRRLRLRFRGAVELHRISKQMDGLVGFALLIAGDRIEIRVWRGRCRIAPSQRSRAIVNNNGRLRSSIFIVRLWAPEWGLGRPRDVVDIVHEGKQCDRA